MTWPYRHIILVAAAEQAAANLIAAEIDPDDGSQTFGVPLSADGSEPATHYGCSTLSDDLMANAMFAVDAANPPMLASVVWWRLDSQTDLLIDRSANAVGGVVGEPWSWTEALSAAGLTFVLPEEEVDSQ